MWLYMQLAILMHHSHMGAFLPCCAPGGEVRNPVRLFGEDSCTKGQVQVQRDGFWGAVCTSSTEVGGQAQGVGRHSWLHLL